MDAHNTDPNEDLPTTKGPDDSSSRYSWVNLHGAKPRDFSTLRRESRPQPRHRITDPEPASPRSSAKDEALCESATPRPSFGTEPPSRPGLVERRKGLRQIQTGPIAPVSPRIETVDSSDPAQRQAARDAEFDLRRHRAVVSSLPPDPTPPTSYRAGETSAMRKIYREPVAEALAEPLTQTIADVDLIGEPHPVDDFGRQRAAADTTSEALPTMPSSSAEAAGPAWLYAPPTPQMIPRPLPPAPATPPASVADTLQYSRERVASRWFALKGVFGQPEESQKDAASPLRQKETRTPLLAVFSLAGGVGKTSLVATVGRSLSAMGEKVLLSDTTSHGLLPFYFGASELQHDTVRTFSPPSGSTDAPIYLLSHEMEGKAKDEAAQELFIEDLIAKSQGMHRILLDLTTASSWMIHQMARMNLTVLVPVAPDMNSVISLNYVEKFFDGIIDADGRPLLPFYVLNQFDPSLPLHLDVREVLRRKLGDRLLPFVIRRAPSVSEALAEGMTVVDYAPDTPIAEDYVNVATWLRTMAAPAAAGFRNVRWTER